MASKDTASQLIFGKGKTKTMAKPPIAKSKVFYEVPPLPEARRKILFPNNPPPTMHELKALKNKPKNKKK